MHCIVVWCVSCSTAMQCIQFELSQLIEGVWLLHLCRNAVWCIQRESKFCSILRHTAVCCGKSYTMCQPVPLHGTGMQRIWCKQTFNLVPFCKHCTRVCSLFMAKFLAVVGVQNMQKIPSDSGCRPSADNLFMIFAKMYIICFCFCQIATTAKGLPIARLVYHNPRFIFWP